jgi:hypothetical protein
MKRFIENSIKIIFSFQMGFILSFIILVVLLIINAKSCTEEVKRRGLKNILNETVEEYWEADSAEVDSTNE